MKIVWAIFDPGWLSRRGSSRIENDALRQHHRECESRFGHRPDRGGRPPARRITSSLDQIADVICARLHFHPAVGLILLEVVRHVAGEEGLRIHPSSLPCFSISSYFGNFDRSTVSKFVPKIANSSRTSMSSYSRYPSWVSSWSIPSARNASRRFTFFLSSASRHVARAVSDG
jgi:hypothetical protein